MNAKITSFLTFNTSSSLPHLFWMLGNSYSLNILKLSMWDCGWLLTVYLFLKWFASHHINIKVLYWTQIFSARNRALLWEPFTDSLGEAIAKIIVFQIMFFYRLWHIRSFIHTSVEITYGFRVDASENRPYIHIQLHFTLFIQKWNDINCLP